jgi:DNA-directed RNA polymerase subunit RPC12/RpoP
LYNKRQKYKNVECPKPILGKYEWGIEVDTRDENCRKCGTLLFKVVPLPPKGRYWAMSDEMPLDLKPDDDDKFYKCPHCGAKNVIVSRGEREGEPPQYEILFWKE